MARLTTGLLFAVLVACVQCTPLQIEEVELLQESESDDPAPAAAEPNVAVMQTTEITKPLFDVAAKAEAAPPAGPELDAALAAAKTKIEGAPGMEHATIVEGHSVEDQNQEHMIKEARDAGVPLADLAAEMKAIQEHELTPAEQEATKISPESQIPWEKKPDAPATHQVAKVTEDEEVEEDAYFE